MQEKKTQDRENVEKVGNVVLEIPKPQYNIV